jgi:hypothetical protein
VHEARDGVEFSVADPDLDPRLRLDVVHPVGSLALGNKVEVPAMLSEPDLDFTRLTGDAASGDQVEVHGTRRTTSISVRNPRLLDLSAVVRLVPKKSSSAYWLALAALVLERDAILDPTAAKTLPSSVQAAVLDGAGHMPHIEAASTVNEKDAVDRQ